MDRSNLKLIVWAAAAQQISNHRLLALGFTSAQWDLISYYFTLGRKQHILHKVASSVRPDVTRLSMWRRLILYHYSKDYQLKGISCCFKAWKAVKPATGIIAIRSIQLLQFNSKKLFQIYIWNRNLNTYHINKWNASVQNFKI